MCKQPEIGDAPSHRRRRNSRARAARRHTLVHEFSSPVAEHKEVENRVWTPFIQDYRDALFGDLALGALGGLLLVLFSNLKVSDAFERKLFLRSRRRIDRCDHQCVQDFRWLVFCESD